MDKMDKIDLLIPDYLDNNDLVKAITSCTDTTLFPLTKGHFGVSKYNLSGDVLDYVRSVCHANVFLPDDIIFVDKKPVRLAFKDVFHIVPEYFKKTARENYNILISIVTNGYAKKEHVESMLEEAKYTYKLMNGDFVNDYRLLRDLMVYDAETIDSHIDKVVYIGSDSIDLIDYDNTLRDLEYFETKFRGLLVSKTNKIFVEKY
jgi:hypothetical protein